MVAATVKKPKAGKGEQQPAVNMFGEIPPEMQDAYARWTQIHTLGGEVKRARNKLDRLETKVAEADAARKEAMTDRNAAQNALDELLDDLAKLANGQNPEHLPFGQPLGGPKADTPSQPPTADPDAWRDVSMADVFAEMKVPVSLADALRDGKIKWTEDVAGIETMGQLASFTKPQEEGGKGRKLGDIAGIGPAKVQQIEDAIDKWWKAHPLPAESTPSTGPTKQRTTSEIGARLEWHRDDAENPPLYWAANSAGIEIEADTLAEFVIKPQGAGYTVDSESSRPLIPAKDVPGEFPDLDAAKLWCENRNGDLVEKIDEFYRGNPTAIAPIESLGFPGGVAQQACHSGLLATLSQGQTGKVRGFCGLKGRYYLVTDAPINDATSGTSEVYAFREVVPTSEAGDVQLDAGGEGLNANPYQGRVVVNDGVEYTILGDAATLLVHDPGEYELKPSDPEPPVGDPMALAEEAGDLDAINDLKDADGDVPFDRQADDEDDAPKKKSTKKAASKKPAKKSAKAGGKKR